MTTESCLGIALGCVLTGATLFALGGCSRLNEPETPLKPAKSRLIKKVKPVSERIDLSRRMRTSPSLTSGTNACDRGIAVEETGASAEASLSEEEKLAQTLLTEQLAAAVARYLENQDDSTARANLERELRAMRAKPFLKAVRTMVRFGAADEKKAALLAMGVRFANSGAVAVQVEETASGEVTATPQAPDADEDDSDDVLLPGDTPGEEKKKLSTEEKSALRTQQIVETVAGAFSDSDESVRLAAVEAAMSLPAEESGILASRLMSEGDSGLQTALLEALAGSKELSDLTISIQALSSDDAKIAALAASNLKEATGQDFGTEKEAAEWLESQSRNFNALSDGQAVFENKK